jgi:hypothetical protein
MRLKKINKKIPFNRDMLNDIRPFVVANLDEFNLSNTQLTRIIDLIYQVFISNYCKISNKCASLDGEITDLIVAEKIKRLYEEFWYGILMAYSFSRINRLPQESFNMILAFSNVSVPVGINDCIFEISSQEVIDLRRRLEVEYARVS